jgi:hypothetical protein
VHEGLSKCDAQQLASGGTQMRRVLATVIVLTLVFAGGCAEHVVIRSMPAGGRVLIDGRPTGVTPFIYAVSRGQLGSGQEVRIEKEGYEPFSTRLRTRVAKGRVVGTFFTLGIVWMFRSMYYIEPVTAELRPIVSATDDADRRLGQSLRNLHELHRSGQISDEEFERRRDQLMSGQ